MAFDIIIIVVLSSNLLWLIRHSFRRVNSIIFKIGIRERNPCDMWVHWSTKRVGIDWFSRTENGKVFLRHDWFVYVGRSASLPFISLFIIMILLLCQAANDRLAMNYKYTSFGFSAHQFIIIKFLMHNVLAVVSEDFLVFFLSLSLHLSLILSFRTSHAGEFATYQTHSPHIAQANYDLFINFPLFYFAVASAAFRGNEQNLAQLNDNIQIGSNWFLWFRRISCVACPNGADEIAYFFVVFSLTRCFFPPRHGRQIRMTARSTNHDMKCLHLFFL